MSLFSAFIALIRADIWPAGEAKTLRTAHTGYVKAAMADMQKWIPDLQVLNTSQYDRCDRLWEDAKTVIEAPNGVIRRVFAITNAEWRDKVFYDSSNMTEVERWAKRLVDAETPDNTGLSPALTRGFKYDSDTTIDNEAGRARIGKWCIYRRKLFLVPWLQSNEVLVIEWDGIKTTYADADVINDTLWTADVIEAIKYYVKWQHELWFGDAGLAREFKANYDGKLADLMVVFRERTRQQEVNPVPEAVTHLTSEMVEDDDADPTDGGGACAALPSEVP